MNLTKFASRRSLLSAGTAMGLTLLGAATRAAGGKTKGKKEADIGPGEDLMREHGVLRRVLLVYGEAGRRLEGPGDFDVGVVQRSAQA